MKNVFGLAAMLCTLLAAGPCKAQNVAALRQSTWDLPVTDTDNTVVGEFFGALGSVQILCPEQMRASLRTEDALAACGSLGQYFNAEIGRSTAEMVFHVRGTWTSPWQANADFGTVRRLMYQGVEYFLAINEQSGTAFVIRFR